MEFIADWDAGGLLAPKDDSAAVTPATAKKISAKGGARLCIKITASEALLATQRYAGHVHEPVTGRMRSSPL